MKLPENLDYDNFISKYKSSDSSVLIDVRTPEEYNFFHLDNSILIDIYNYNFVNEIISLDKNKEYFLYCHSGSRSFQAGIFMLQNGFEKVYNLQDGIRNLILQKIK